MVNYKLITFIHCVIKYNSRYVNIEFCYWNVCGLLKLWNRFCSLLSLNEIHVLIRFKIFTRSRSYLFYYFSIKSYIDMAFLNADIKEISDITLWGIIYNDDFFNLDFTTFRTWNVTLSLISIFLVVYRPVYFLLLRKYFLHFKGCEYYVMFKLLFW